MSQAVSKTRTAKFDSAVALGRKRTKPGTTPLRDEKGFTSWNSVDNPESFQTETDPKGRLVTRVPSPENSDHAGTNTRRHLRARRCTPRAAEELREELVGLPGIRRHDQRLVFVHLKDRYGGNKLS